MSRFITLAVLFATVTACSSVSESPTGSLPGAAPDAGAGGQGGEEPLVEGCSQMDIVFVIDDSGSMFEEQENLVSNFPSFVSVLEGFRGADNETIDYRIAVTTTGLDDSFSPGLNGEFRRGCGSDTPWISRNDGDVSTRFSCLADVGTGGPITEQPLEAVRLAFTDRFSDGKNLGFGRIDSLLAVVVLTDEDDGSLATDGELTDVSEYVGFLDSLKGERGRWAGALITGVDPDGQDEGCDSEFGSAAHAERLIDFAGQAGDNVVTSSICAGDLSIGLNNALEAFESACSRFPPIE